MQFSSHVLAEAHNAGNKSPLDEQLAVMTVVPNLPNELWLHIFRLGTLLPHSFDVEHAMLDNVGPSHRTRKSLLRQTMRTKRSLVRVCRAWNTLTCPLLYEHIVVTKFRTLLSLLRTLRHTALHGRANLSNDLHSLGWWTRRIDFTFAEQHSLAECLDHKFELMLLPDIALKCPNVRIVTFFDYTQFHNLLLPPRFLGVLARADLEALLWYDDGLLPDDEDWHDFMLSAKNLRALRCPLPFSVPPSSSPSDQAFASLEMLCIRDSCDVVLPESALPSIKYAVFQPATQSTLEPFVQVQGRKLTRVYLDVLFDGFSIVQELMDVIARECPKLHRLDIRVENLKAFITCIPAIPRYIRELGLHVFRGQAPEECYSKAFDALVSAKSGWHLQTIYILSQDNVLDMLKMHQQTVEKAVDLLNTLGVAVLDYEGLPVLPST